MVNPKLRMTLDSSDGNNTEWHFETHPNGLQEFMFLSNFPTHTFLCVSVTTSLLV